MVFTRRFGSQFVVTETDKIEWEQQGTFQAWGFNSNVEMLSLIDNKIREGTPTCALSR